MKSNSLWIILYRMRMPFIAIILSYTVAIIGLTTIEGMDANGNPHTMGIFDAFYFLSYTATTIGFGEIPYAFNYSQKLWVTLSIYLTVLSWFYGIGTIVSLLQDKLFLEEIAKNKFINHIKRLHEDFIIVLGYNNITKEVIKQALLKNLRVVVIEQNQIKINELHLEGFIPFVPALKADAHNPYALEAAGVKSKYCKGLVALFEQDYLNLRIALTAKTLNAKVPLAIKSTTPNQSENLKDIGVEIIENPFEIIGGQIDKALNAPSLLKIERWLYKTGTIDMEIEPFPKGKYIVCGYGRMGRVMREVLEKNNIKASFIEIDTNQTSKLARDEKQNIITADSDDKEILTQAGIKDAVAIIIGTNNDTTNLSILATAIKLNPNIITIVRENEMEDFSIFKNRRIDNIFMPPRLLITKTTNALIRPMIDKFSKQLDKQDEEWGNHLIKKLLTIGTRPHVISLVINEDAAPQIIHHIKKDIHIDLGVLLRSRQNREHHNKIFALLLKRQSTHKEILLPSQETQLFEGDSILFACSKEAKTDLEYIAQNYNEFLYAAYLDNK